MLVRLLTEEEKENKGLFGIFSLNGDPGQSVIRANQKGLSTFLAVLAHALLRYEKEKERQATVNLPVTYDGNWLHTDSDTILHFIEITATPQNLSPAPLPDQKPSLRDRLLPAGCLVLGLLLLLALLIGIWTIGQWIFT